MDLSELDTQAGANAGFELELKHPTRREPLGVFITVRGADSDAYQAKAREIARRRLENMAKGEKTASPEQVQAESLEMLGAATIGWKNVQLDGKALDCEPPSVRK